MGSIESKSRVGIGLLFTQIRHCIGANRAPKNHIQCAKSNTVCTASRGQGAVEARTVLRVCDCDNPKRRPPPPSMPTIAPTKATDKPIGPRKKGTKKKVVKRDATSSIPRMSSKRSKYEEEMAFESTISRILLRRFEHDIARLFSTHVHRIAESQLPRLIMSALQIAPPGWLALNASSEQLKDCESTTCTHIFLRMLMCPVPWLHSLPWCPLA